MYLFIFNVIFFSKTVHSYSFPLENVYLEFYFNQQVI